MMPICTLKTTCCINAKTFLISKTKKKYVKVSRSTLRLNNGFSMEVFALEYQQLQKCLLHIGNICSSKL